MLLWLCNGIWHGAGYQYIFFGLYHFVFILLGRIFLPLFNKMYAITKLNRENFIIKIFAIIRTSIIVLFGELFFRAVTVTAGLEMFKSIFTNFHFKELSKSVFKLGIDRHDFLIIAITLIIVFIISILKEKNINVREKISNFPLPIRWIIYYILIFYIVFFGAYGYGYIPIDPMYANF